MAQKPSSHDHACLRDECIPLYWESCSEIFERICLWNDLDLLEKKKKFFEVKKKSLRYSQLLWARLSNPSYEIKGVFIKEHSIKNFHSIWKWIIFILKFFKAGFLILLQYESWLIQYDGTFKFLRERLRFGKKLRVIAFWSFWWFLEVFVVWSFSLIFYKIHQTKTLNWFILI